MHVDMTTTTVSWPLSHELRGGIQEKKYFNDCLPSVHDVGEENVKTAEIEKKKHVNNGEVSYT